MRFSIFPSLTQPWSDVVAAVRHAEATGWDGVYLADHFVGEAGSRPGSKPLTPGYLESTAALAAVAATTERPRLGALVFGITYRHPAVLANMARHLAPGGKLVAGFQLQQGVVPCGGVTRGGGLTIPGFDALAAEAGLTLHERFATWDRERSSAL